MGWGYGHNRQGREVGYNVAAKCDESDCEVEIDRGLAYACGGEHDGGEYGCGKYFCAEHLTYAALSDDDVTPQVCRACCERIEREVAASSAPEAGR